MLLLLNLQITLFEIVARIAINDIFVMSSGGSPLYVVYHFVLMTKTLTTTQAR